jgi:transposase
VHLAGDTLGHLLALHGPSADAQERAQVAQLAAQVQGVAGDAAAVASVDQGYTGEQPAQEAAAHGLPLEGVKLPKAKQGVAFLPHRRVVEHSMAWAARVRRLARDDERLPATPAGVHCLACVMLLLKRLVALMAQSASHALDDQEDFMPCF